tara:strand:+ start:238 stop:663 length:426 start_codon:yes stop_codon:yes gene_type:complete
LLSLKEKKKTVFIFVFDMGKIFLKNIRFYAYHGCMLEEEKIGSDYIVNLNVNTDLSHSSVTDKLEDTVDYVSLLAIVKKQMSKRSNLLENLADRIIKQIFNDLPKVNKVNIRVSKKNPPIGGDVEEVCVERELKRSSLESN